MTLASERPPLRDSLPTAPVGARRTQPVTYWAVLGGATLAFILIIWGKWVTGPYFTTVPSGPDVPPLWMRAILMGWQIVIPPLALYLVYRTVIRPWRRERHVPFDGLMIVSFFFMWFWDPWSSYTGHWFTYNSYLYNKGSWVNDIPGFLASGRPGAQLPEPLLLDGPIYMTAFMLGAVLGTMAMRKAKARWPHCGPGRLIGVCFLSMMLFDLVIEGMIWIPMGYYTYAGGHFSLFPDSYHKFPLHEMIFAGALWTGFAILRYFTNDKGETLAERGSSRLKISPVKKTIVRFLAVLAAMSVVFNITFNIPIALFIANHSDTWPKAVQERSYFTDHICGAGTDTMCPGPGVPNSRGADSTHLDTDGRVVVPPGIELNKPVPQAPATKPVTPYSGPLFGTTTN